jgi:extradiol dioxygenase family protein
MIKIIKTYSSFSVPDLKEAKKFYGETLGLSVNERPEGLDLKIGEENNVFIYFSPQNKPADFTVLNFVMEDVEEAVDELLSKGVMMEQYDMPGIKTDEKGIARSDGNVGPKLMAWLKDPAGNILALSQKSKS